MKSSKPRLQRIISLLFAALFVCLSSLAQQPPPTPKRPANDLYHGITVLGNDRWLENFADPQAKQWIAVSGWHLSDRR
ncbi:MAG: hypothetical protein ACJ74Z_20470 [Bryobacteraceae bacterium]|jgi:hypothetical protein